MAKSSRRNPSYRKNASRFHVSVGEMLRSSSLTGNLRLYQEYPANLICPYLDSRLRYDWVILDWKVAIELHGQHHYQPVRFGGITQEEAETNLQTQQERDIIKEEGAVKAGWSYIVFKYDEPISLETLLKKIEKAQPNNDVVEENYKKNPGVSKQKTPWHKRQLQRAKEYRQRKYREWKEKHNDKRHQE